MKRLPFFLGLLVVAVPGAIAAQTPAEIVDRMLEAFLRSTSGIDDYTVVQEVMGFRSELYFEKETVDGRPVFQLKRSSTAGASMDMEQDLGYSDVYAVGPDLARHSRYGGTEQVDGERVHVLVIDDLAALDLVPTTPEDTEFRATRGRILVDAEIWVPRRMEFVGDMDTGDGPVEVTSVIDLRDYRSDQGLLLPYLTVVRMEGLGAAMDPEMLAEFEEMRRQLEDLPPEQRAMVEQMFAGQMEQMEALLNDEGGAMTVEMRILEVRVNQGPPG